MAGSSEDRWRRPSHGDLRGEEPEEGELVPGYHSDVDTEEYYNRHCSSSDSDETISDSNAACSVVPACCYVGHATSSLPVAANSLNNGGEASSSSLAAPAVLPCPVCGKVYSSQKAVCGHMKVHAHGIGRQQEQGNGKGKGIKRDVAALVGAWGGTGKRGCSGLGARAASPNAESDQSTMAIVVAEPNIVLQPMPLAFAPPNLSSVPMTSPTPMASAAPDLSSVPVASAMINVSGQSTSAQPMPNDATDTVVAVAGAANPASDAIVHLHAAPPPAAEGEQSPPVHQPRIAPAAAGGRQNPNGYPCDQCDLWFSTHQALGGHKAGHKSREVAAAAAGALEDGAAPCGRNARPEKAHVCKVCGAVFAAGVQLGGHMRKHYTGPPIVPNKKPRLSIQQPLLPPPVLTLAPPVNADGAPAVEVSRGSFTLLG